MADLKVDSWPILFKSFQRLWEQMETRVRQAGFPPLEIYDVLWTLEQAPEHRMRFKELGEAVFLAKSNVTRLCERLETQGLLKRKKCPQDRRGVWAELSPKGLKLRKDIWKALGPIIQEEYSSRLSQEQHSAVIDIFQIFKKRFDL